MTNTNTLLAAAGAFVLGVLIALGADHFVLGHKDQRDAMASIGNFKDWRLSCPPRTEKKSGCVMQTMITQKGTTQAISEINIVKKDDTDQLTVVAPLGVVVLAGVKLDIGSAPEKTIAFKTCIQMGCIATTPIDGPLASALSSADTGQIALMTMDGKSVPLTFSLHGYRDAFAARAVDTAARK
jgi:invasion protein IalB